MKVILLQDVKGTGKKDQVLEVSDGFARNYLLPRKLGLEATAVAMNAVSKSKAADAHREEVKKQEAIAMAMLLKGKVIIVKARSGENGRLYGSITAQEIADALEQQHHIAIDKRKLDLAEPIRQLGNTDITVRIYPGVTTPMTVHVVAGDK